MKQRTKLLLAAVLGLLAVSVWYFGELQVRKDLRQMGHESILQGSFPQTTPSYLARALFGCAGVLAVVAFQASPRQVAV